MNPRQEQNITQYHIYDKIVNLDEYKQRIPLYRGWCELSTRVYNILYRGRGLRYIDYVSYPVAPLVAPRGNCRPRPSTQTKASLNKVTNPPMPAEIKRLVIGNQNDKTNQRFHKMAYVVKQNK